MRKAQQLHAALLVALPALRASPDRMLMFIDEGTIAARPERLGFAYRYCVQLVIIDYSDHLDSVMVPLLAWVARHEPSLLQNANLQADGLRFKVEVIHSSSMDLEISLQLSETVGLQAKSGKVLARHHAEVDEEAASVWDQLPINGGVQYVE